MSSRSAPLEAALAGVPDDFRERLVGSFADLKQRFREGKHDAAGLAAGKFCEVALRLLQHAVTGAYTPFSKKIGNFADECRALIMSSNALVAESLRVIVPRGLVFLYTMRNKRGIGHVGGDVDANAIDLATMVRTADWIVCEFIRAFHSLSLEEAQDIVDSLAQREMPDVWEVAGKKRVLRAGLTKPQQTLLLLYSEPSQSVPAEDLHGWVEYTSFSMFRTRVLAPLHLERLIEFDDELRMVFLSPKGAQLVEATLLVPAV
jgi:hypothetical protein